MGEAALRAPNAERARERAAPVHDWACRMRGASDGGCNDAFARATSGRMRDLAGRVHLVRDDRATQAGRASRSPRIRERAGRASSSGVRCRVGSKRSRGGGGDVCAGRDAGEPARRAATQPEGRRAARTQRDPRNGERPHEAWDAVGPAHGDWWLLRSRSRFVRRAVRLRRMVFLLLPKRSVRRLQVDDAQVP